MYDLGWKRTPKGNSWEKAREREREEEKEEEREGESQVNSPTVPSVSLIKNKFSIVSRY